MYSSYKNSKNMYHILKGGRIKDVYTNLMYTDLWSVSKDGAQRVNVNWYESTSREFRILYKKFIEKYPEPLMYIPTLNEYNDLVDMMKVGSELMIECKPKYVKDGIYGYRLELHSLSYPSHSDKYFRLVYKFKYDGAEFTYAQPLESTVVYPFLFANNESYAVYALSENKWMAMWNYQKLAIDYLEKKWFQGDSEKVEVHDADQTYIFTATEKREAHTYNIFVVKNADDIGYIYIKNKYVPWRIYDKENVEISGNNEHLLDACKEFAEKIGWSAKENAYAYDIDVLARGKKLLNGAVDVIIQSDQSGTTKRFTSCKFKQYSLVRHDDTLHFKFDVNMYIGKDSRGTYKFCHKVRTYKSILRRHGWYYKFDSCQYIEILPNTFDDMEKSALNSIFLNGSSLGTPYTFQLSNDKVTMELHPRAIYYTGLSYLKGNILAHADQYMSKLFDRFKIIISDAKAKTESTSKGIPFGTIGKMQHVLSDLNETTKVESSNPPKINVDVPRFIGNFMDKSKEYGDKRTNSSFSFLMSICSYEVLKDFFDLTFCSSAIDINDVCKISASLMFYKVMPEELCNMWHRIEDKYVYYVSGDDLPRFMLCINNGKIKIFVSNDINFKFIPHLHRIYEHVKTLMLRYIPTKK